MLASRAPINRLVAMQLPYCLPWHDQRLNGISTFRVADSIHASQHRSVVVSRVWGGSVAVWVPGVSCLCPGMRGGPGARAGLGRGWFWVCGKPRYL